MNLSTLALPQSSNLHPWKIPEACPDNWHAAANLNRFQCNIKIDGKDCTVEFASNKDLNRLASTQSLAVLLHGYGVGGSSMMTLCEPLNDYDEPFICPNLLGAGSVFPSDFKFTPQNISQIYASMIRAISPNALTIFGFGNSMGGMFMEGTRVLLGDEITFNRTFINSMGLHVTGGSPEQKWPEPKASAVLYQALCIAAQTGSLPLLSKLITFSFTFPLIGYGARLLYAHNLYNTPSSQHRAHLDQIFFRKVREGTMSPLDIMASMAAYVVLPESTLLNTRSAWQNFVGESLSQNSGNTLVAANIGDAVFSIEHGENLAQQLGTDLITIEGGSHLPDENTASIIVKKVFEATRRTSGVIEITGSAHRRSA